MSLTRTTFAQMANSTRPAPRWLIASAVTTLIVAGVLTSRPEAQVTTAALHGVGQLSGALRTGTVIRDATRVGGVIYAVGGAAARVCGPATFLCGETDTAVLWRRGGTWPAGALEALPDNFNNTTVTTPHTAYAITPDAAYIGSQTRIGADNARRAARVTTSLLPSPLANLIFGSTLSPAPLAVVAMSNDGTLLYGTTNEGTFNFPGFPHRAARFDAATNTSLFVPFVAPSDTWNPVAEKGSSADGTVAVGSSFLDATNHKAYRYVHGSGVAAIPFLPGGTFNDGVAVSADGNLVLVTGNSTAYPNGEAYFYTASTGAIEPLGSPNSRWRPGCGLSTACVTSVPGGMTADGSVVVMSFHGGGDQAGYFRNTHGWFQLTSALAAHGVDLAAEGWDSEGLGLRVHGISPDGTLVSGAGRRNGILEGFVAEFAPGDLATFNPQAAPPASTALVGVWNFDPSEGGAPHHVVVFTADGAYYHIEEGDGFERGLYTFDGSNVSFTTLLDTNGNAGLSDANGLSFPVGAPSGDALLDENGEPFAHRFPGAAGTIAGGWTFGSPTERDSSFVLALLGADNGNRYFMANDNPDFGFDGFEVGTYTWDGLTRDLTFLPEGGPLDTGYVATLSADGLGLVVVDNDEANVTPLVRVVDPSTIPVIADDPPLSASGIAGQAFTYQVPATNAVTFSAASLPDGLSINSNTGAIIGTPTVGGQFVVTIAVTNGAGVSDFAAITLTIAIPTPIGQDVVVAPVVPEGQGPVTMTFGEITTAGTTTVTVVDQSEVPAPGTVAIGGVVYEVTTTATYTGLIELCFSYAGIDFGAATPRLFHYENGVWVDITTSVDAGTQTICGATTTLSPFAVLVSNVVRTGFYAPVNPVAGFLNSVKAGSTVPLKFEVFVNGVEQTSTLGLAMTQTLLASCDSNAPEDPVEPAPTTGGTTMRYDATAGQFIQNWKVPKAPGACYMVRMTTAQDGLALTARFIVR